MTSIVSPPDHASGDDSGDPGDRTPRLQPAPAPSGDPHAGAIRPTQVRPLPTRPSRKRAAASSPMPVMSVPAISTLPALGFSSPAATIRSEDLPEPEGPVIATVWPAGTVRETPARMSTGPARLLRVRRTS